MVRGTTGGAWCQWSGREGPRGERDHGGGMVSVAGERGATW